MRDQFFDGVLMDNQSENIRFPDNSCINRETDKAE
jgi:hypothetical protein